MPASATGATRRSCEEGENFVLSKESSDHSSLLAVLLPRAASEAAGCRCAARSQVSRVLLHRRNIAPSEAGLGRARGCAEVEELQEIRWECEADGVWMPTVEEPAW